ncbi:ABC transporter G family member 8-like protein [Cinnamomum micranthum f. kanehirae]|uniref:ABC transporter G family member 8-like protein n=1 Tax=Cinnamomum micranthum f. kanehirae TaxID=337451 RepID=A0A3S3NIQ9_9MAGN|nr:ABC transporter G family member 8-like protein [Cinnamomum micranthum f. kanehirae]
MDVDDQSPTLPHHKTYEITACSISYTKTTSTSATSFLFKPCTPSQPTYILRDVSFTARPSQLLAIVGPSGAGKSTLLDILAARTLPTQGSLLLNNSPLHPASFRKIAAYVPQHDASLPLLSILETFTFAAQLLLPPTCDVSSVVASLLADLRLSHLAHTRLASGLSGGERRRVSIGLSLLHDPSVLLLDEPTSGLDSTSAFNIMQTLGAIASSRRRTVIVSIHQPSFKILSIIDSVLLLSKGTVIHHGSMSSLEGFLLSNGFTVPPQLNALEYAMEILNQLHDKKELTVTDEPALSSSSSPSHSSNSDLREMRYTSSRIREIFTLYNRFWKIIYRTKQLLLTNTLEALGVGIFLGTIYIHVGLDKQGMEKRLGLFAFTLTFLLSSTTETLPIFVSERPILLRETSSGVYRLSSHLIANTLVFLPYLLAIAVIYSASVYFLVGLCASWQAFTYFVLVIWSVVLMANSLVLFLSSIAPNYIAGTSLVTMCLASFFLFSGYFISKDSMPKYWLFMHYFSLYKYALDALLINEYSCLLSRCLIWFEEGKVCAVTGRDILEKRGLHERQRWTNVQIMLGFFVFYRMLCLLVLRRRISLSRK